MTRVQNSKPWRRIALFLLLGGCVGGQSGEPACIGPASELKEAEGVPAGASAPFEGAYDVPLHWVGDAELYEHVDPQEAETTNLHLEVRGRSGPAMIYSFCARRNALHLPVEVRVESGDGRLHATVDAWLATGAVQDGIGDSALLVDGLGRLAVDVGGSDTLFATLHTDGRVTGHLNGDSHGRLGPHVCGGVDQTPLDAPPPSTARFEGYASIEDAISLIDNETFELAWGDAQRVAAVLKVTRTSETACWEVNPELELVSPGAPPEASFEVGVELRSLAGEVLFAAEGSGWLGACKEIDGPCEALLSLAVDGSVYAPPGANGILALDGPLLTGGLVGPDELTWAEARARVEFTDGAPTLRLRVHAITGLASEDSFEAQGTPAP